MTPQPLQITSIRIPQEYENGLCLYPIIVNGNSYWCNQNKYHHGDHTADGGYFQIHWRSGLIV